MSSEDFSCFLNSISEKPISVLDSTIPHSKYVSIDLSEGNADLQNFDVSSSGAWQKYIADFLKNIIKLLLMEVIVNLEISINVVSILISKI